MDTKLEALFEFLGAEGGDMMTRMWFPKYYDPSISPAENMNQAKAAVKNGWVQGRLVMFQYLLRSVLQ